MSLATSQPAANAWILYEFPFNERIRTLLRLEDLFLRFEFFLEHEHPLHHHTALLTLFEIMEVGARADLKSDLLQEMERQRQLLSQYRNSPAINTERLEEVLTELEQTISELNACNGRLGQHLRENEWLMSIRSRTSIPGGVCEFDIPGYHAWQHAPTEVRRRDILQWIDPMLPLIRAIRVVLRLLRDSGGKVSGVAKAGSFTQPMGGKTYQLLRLRLPMDSAVVPEFSANKYMLLLRFNQPTQGQEAKNRPYEGDVEFDMRLCNL